MGTVRKVPRGVFLSHLLGLFSFPPSLLALTLALVLLSFEMLRSFLPALFYSSLEAARNTAIEGLVLVNRLSGQHRRRFGVGIHLLSSSPSSKSLSTDLLSLSLSLALLLFVLLFAELLLLCLALFYCMSA